MKLNRLFTIAGLLTVVLAGIAGCRGVPDGTKNQEVALNFLKNSPTYKFDGIGGSFYEIKLIETKAIENVDCVFTYEFSCAHPGYGDRSGFSHYYKVKITRHTATIIVTNGEVRSAFIDEVWDMQRQAYAPVESQP